MPRSFKNVSIPRYLYTQHHKLPAFQLTHQIRTRHEYLDKSDDSIVLLEDLLGQRLADGQAETFKQLHR